MFCFWVPAWVSHWGNVLHGAEVNGKLMRPQSQVSGIAIESERETDRSLVLNMDRNIVHGYGHMQKHTHAAIHMPTLETYPMTMGNQLRAIVTQLTRLFA